MRMSEMCILLVKFHIRWHFCLLSYDQHQDLPSLAKHEGHSSSVDQQLTTRSCTNIFWICSKNFHPNWLIFEIIHVMIQNDDNFLNWLKVMFDMLVIFDCVHYYVKCLWRNSTISTPGQSYQAHLTYAIGINWYRFSLAQVGQNWAKKGKKYKSKNNHQNCE